MTKRRMKVILLSDVPNVGRKYDVTEVKPGFARNFLFVQGLAEAVTKSSAKRVAEMEAKREAEKKRQEVLLEKAFAGVKGATVTLKRPANEEGHLYAGITKEEVAEALSKAVGATFEAQHIDLEKPLKALGEFEIPVEVKGKTATFTVKVEAE